MYYNMLSTLSNLAILGLIPVAFHIDGVEFYANTEHYVWSLQSVFTTGEAVGPKHSKPY
jgi:hypothetical protein